MSNLDYFRLRRDIEEAQHWRDEMPLIPWLQFPADWKIQITPPFSDAVVRFRVMLPSGDEKSIYLDSRDSLGYVGQPYWEVFPYRGDVGWCLRADAAELLRMIADEQESEE